MRVVISAESFFPRTNGVANSVAQVSRELSKRDIPCLIIAPDSYAHDDFEGTPVHRVRSVELPGVHDVDIALASSHAIERELRRFQPTVVHLASPMTLGRQVLHAAQRLDVPTVAVFQTDVAGFAEHYRMGSVSFLADAVVRRIHRQATLTLAPSQASLDYLRGIQVHSIRSWGRGVDLDRFSPDCRSEQFRSMAGRGQPLVGYVGRLAPEKNIGILASLARAGDVRVVVVGDGPSRRALTEAMPGALFTGRLDGAALATAFASFDVVVATGENETFCQVIQEAMASGTPVVAPRIGGPVDLIDQGVTGLFYEPGDAQGLQAQVRSLLNDDQLRRGMGGAARAKVTGRSWGALTEELIQHFRAVTHRTGLREAA